MELVFVLVSLAAVSLVFILLISVAAGIAALCGIPFSTVFVKGLWLLVIPPATVLYGWLVGRNRVIVNEVVINTERIPASFDGYRIVHISDMHLRSYRHRVKALSSVVGRIGSLKPDLVAFSGDLVTNSPSEIGPFIPILSRLDAKDGVVSVMGNHDYCPYNDWDSEAEMEAAVERVRSMERQMGWNLLDDAFVRITRGRDSITVAGVGNISAMPQFDTHGDLGKALEGAGDGFKILLSHDPTFWKAGVAGHTDIDLTLSGHTHNSQLRIFGLEPSRLVFRENSGLYRDGGQYLYVNDGLGETMFPARIGVPPEITLITLRCVNNNKEVYHE